MTKTSKCKIFIFLLKVIILADRNYTHRRHRLDDTLREGYQTSQYIVWLSRKIYCLNNIFNRFNQRYPYTFLTTNGETCITILYCDYLTWRRRVQGYRQSQLTLIIFTRYSNEKYCNGVTNLYCTYLSWRRKRSS